jgi:hypothetical protein
MKNTHHARMTELLIGEDLTPASFDLPGADDTYSDGINDQENVVETYVLDNVSHGFVSYSRCGGPAPHALTCRA